MLLTIAWLLWVILVWYANYVECDDRLRDEGVRFEPGRLERCTLPQRPFEVHELYWLLGTLVFLACLFLARSLGKRPGELPHDHDKAPNGRTV